MRAIGALLLGIAVVLLLRSTALSAATARGVALDVLAFATVVWALRHGTSWGASFGFALGLFADLDAAHWIGRHALVLTLEGYVIGRLASTLVRESARAQFALLLGATAIHEVWAVSFEMGGWSAWAYLVVRVALSSIVTAGLGALILAAARRVTGRPLFAHVSVQPGKTL